MRAAAEFAAEAIADLDDAHSLTVLIAEEHLHSRQFLGLRDREFLRLYLQVLVDLLVHQTLDLRFLRVVHRPSVREVERELIGLDLAAALLDVFAEDLVQGPVQQVGGGVVLAGEVAQEIDRQVRNLARLNASLRDLTHEQ